ncbi:MAG: efflux RND transporter periplasmic adaptor subunit, partial [bacterium]
VLLIALVLGGWAYMSQSRAPQTTYQYATIANGNLTLTVSATGPVQAGIYNLNFATSGQIAEIDVTVGQQVAAEQVLAKLDTTALQAAVNLAQQQANVAYDQEQAAIAACSTERNPPVDCVQQAKNAYAAVINQLQTAQRNLAGATLTAPHAGVENSINGTVGSAPSTGGSGTSSSAFIQVVDPSSLTLSASVNEADIGDITVGQQATFTVTSYKGVAFHATVASISQVGSSTSSVVTYPVTFTVDMTRLQGAHLLSGMTATVTITRAQRVNVLLVPASAVTFGRAAASTTSGGFLTRTQVSDVRTQAQQLLTTLQAQNPQISQESPALAWVLERTNGKWVVKPVVL